MAGLGCIRTCPRGRRIQSGNCGSFSGLLAASNRNLTVAGLENKKACCPGTGSRMVIGLLSISEDHPKEEKTLVSS